MSSNKHPNKEIEEALLYAEGNKWQVENSNGHPFGQMYCPYKDSGSLCEGSGKWCRVGVWSTPGNPVRHARHLKRIIDRCLKQQADNDDERV